LHIFRESFRAGRPHWDGARVTFEVENGTGFIECAISKAALQSLSEARVFRPSDMLRRFSEDRKRIEAIALYKYHAQPERVPGRLNIWESDIEDLPPHRTPAVAAIAIC